MRVAPQPVSQLGPVAAPERAHTAKSAQSHHFSSQHGSRGTSLSGQVPSVHFARRSTSASPNAALNALPSPAICCSAQCGSKSKLPLTDRNECRRALIEGLDANAPRPMDGTGASSLSSTSQLNQRHSELQARRSKLQQLEELFERQYGDAAMAVQTSSHPPLFAPSITSTNSSPIACVAGPRCNIPMVAINWWEQACRRCSSDATHPTKAKRRRHVAI